MPKKSCGIRDSEALTEMICFIVSKLTAPKSKLSDSNLPVFVPKKITMTLYSKDKCHLIKISVIVLLIGQLM